MNFTSFYNNLYLEKQLSYNIPEDKEKLMYDFYTLSYLSQFNLLNNTGPKVSGFGEVMKTPTMRRELDLDTIENFRDIKKTLLDHLKKHMLNAVLFAISAEFRHIFANNNNKRLVEFFEERNADDFIRDYAITYKSLNTDFGDFLKVKNKRTLKRYQQDNRGYLDSYTAVKQTDIAESRFIELAEESFLKLNWSSSYGGKPWANICSGWTRLFEAKNESALFVAIDHIYDLQHNTDTVFNKLKSYYKDGGYKWIKNALDHKANLRNPYELLDKSSGTIRVLAKKILKSEGFEGWEDYLRSKGILPKKETENNSKPFDEWQVGDIVKCINPGSNRSLQKNKEYKITKTDVVEGDEYVHLDIPGTQVFLASRFEWVSSSEGKDKQHSEWKKGDIVEMKAGYKYSGTKFKIIDKYSSYDSSESFLDLEAVDGSGGLTGLSSKLFDWVGEKAKRFKKVSNSSTNKTKTRYDFQIGDIVTVKDPTYTMIGKPGEQFEVTGFSRNGRYLHITSLLNNFTHKGWLATRFKKVRASSKPEKTTSTEDFKVGDIVMAEYIDYYRYFKITNISDHGMITIDEIDDSETTIMKNFANYPMKEFKKDFKKLHPDHDFFKI